MDTSKNDIVNTTTKKTNSSSPLDAVKKTCDEVANVNAGDTNQMAAKLQQMILDYYRDVRKQTQQSFYSALGAAIIGTLFFIYAAWLEMNKYTTSSEITLVSGALIQVISAINFFLYGKAARQFSIFHICLERTNRFILANTLCDNISCPVKRDISRQDIIQNIVNAPMLTLGVIEGEKKHSSNHIKADLKKAEVNLEPSLS